MTIARNLTTDHFKAGRTRLEYDHRGHVARTTSATEGPESSVLASLTNEALLAALTELPHEQQECLIMRFLQGLSHRRDRRGARPQRRAPSSSSSCAGVRNLAKLLPEGLR